MLAYTPVLRLRAGRARERGADQYYSLDVLAHASMLARRNGKLRRPFVSVRYAWRTAHPPIDASPPSDAGLPVKAPLGPSQARYNTPC